MKYLIGMLMALSLLMSCNSTSPSITANTYMHTKYADSIKVANGERPDYEHKSGYADDAKCTIIAGIYAFDYTLTLEYYDYSKWVPIGAYEKFVRFGSRLYDEIEPNRALYISVTIGDTTHHMEFQGFPPNHIVDLDPYIEEAQRMLIWGHR